MKFLFSEKGMRSALGELRQLAKGMAGDAMVDALNHTASQARQALQAEINDVFNNPSPWVLNSIYMKNATSSAPEAALWVKENKIGTTGRGFDDWMAPQVYGGARLNKGSEKILRQAGILPAGRFIAPGAGARLDAGGGISRGQVVQIISGLRAFTGKNARNNATSSGRSKGKGNAQAFFVMRRGKTPVGIAERRGDRLVIVLAFVSQPSYLARFHFHAVAERVAIERFTANLDKAMVQALPRVR